MIITLNLQKNYGMRIVLVGTGNLATRLGMALHAGNIEIAQVFGRSAAAASQLADLLSCPFTSHLEELLPDADLYLMAVSESALPLLLKNERFHHQFLVHTSGSIPMELLSHTTENFGVFYPLQTLSKQKEVNFRNVPICIEANNKVNLETLQELASLISDKVIQIDSNNRKYLHLSAVFVCNFVNHLYAIGGKLLEEKGLDFQLLRPLIAETAEKAALFLPEEVQTGPAVRNNQPIMDLHLQMLEQHPEWQKIYEVISNDIKRFHPPIHTNS